MRHLDQELLAGLALGDVDPLSTADRAHLRVCLSCATDLAELRRIVSTGRGAKPYPLRSPQPSVLAQIQAEIASDSSQVAGLTTPAPAVAPARLHPRRAATRPVRRYLVAAVAAVALAAVLVAGVSWYRHNQDVVVASATLTPLPDKSGQGKAELIRKNGVEQLSVSIKSDVVFSGFEELWLINTDGQRMISLGIVPPDGSGSYPMPVMKNGSLNGYTIVDISLEPFDGNAAHSHNSLLRGTLD